jgi:hypothetical protein
MVVSKTLHPCWRTRRYLPHKSIIFNYQGRQASIRFGMNLFPRNHLKNTLGSRSSPFPEPYHGSR